MELIEKLTCTKCGENYLGRFKINLNGKITCIDCEQKEFFGQLSLVEVDSIEDTTNTELLSEIMENLLIEDIEKVYKPQSEINEDYTAHLYDDNGDLDINKMYYQKNPLDIVLESHKISVQLIPYLESTENKKLVKKFLQTYSKLREVKFTEQEVAEFWDLILSEEIQKIIID